MQGYKHYHHRKISPLFAFGHGLSYTTFGYSGLELSKPVVSNGDLSLTASVVITNSGSLPGSEVVQLYITMPTTSDLSHPPLMLKSFAKVNGLEPGKSEKVELRLDKYAVSYWDERIARWIVEKGVYAVRAGPSSDRLLLEGMFKLTEGFEWNGL
jgi:beta-glucosidase